MCEDNPSLQADARQQPTVKMMQSRPSKLDQMFALMQEIKQIPNLFDQLTGKLNKDNDRGVMMYRAMQALQQAIKAEEQQEVTGPDPVALTKEQFNNLFDHDQLQKRIRDMADAYDEISGVSTNSLKEIATVLDSDEDPFLTDEGLFNYLKNYKHDPFIDQQRIKEGVDNVRKRLFDDAHNFHRMLLADFPLKIHVFDPETKTFIERIFEPISEKYLEKVITKDEVKDLHKPDSITEPLDEHGKNWHKGKTLAEVWAESLGKPIKVPTIAPEPILHVHHWHRVSDVFPPVKTPLLFYSMEHKEFHTFKAGFRFYRDLQHHIDVASSDFWAELHTDADETFDQQVADLKYRMNTALANVGEDVNPVKRLHIHDQPEADSRLWVENKPDATLPAVEGWERIEFIYPKEGVKMIMFSSFNKEFHTVQSPFSSKESISNFIAAAKVDYWAHLNTTSAIPILTQASMFKERMRKVFKFDL